MVRGTPLIVQILFIFIALPQLAGGGPDWLRRALILDPIMSAILAISIFHAAYLAEVFRAAFQSVPPGQWEASAAMGMTLRQTKRRIIWPQAIRFALAPTGNHFVMILKDSALVGFLGVPVLFQRAQRIGSQNLRLFETILIAALIYWLLTIAFRRLLGISERRMGDRLREDGAVTRATRIWLPHQAAEAERVRRHMRPVQMVVLATVALAMVTLGDQLPLPVREGAVTAGDRASGALRVVLGYGSGLPARFPRSSGPAVVPSDLQRSGPSSTCPSARECR